MDEGPGGGEFDIGSPQSPEALSGGMGDLPQAQVGGAYIRCLCWHCPHMRMKTGGGNRFTHAGHGKLN